MAPAGGYAAGVSIHFPISTPADVNVDFRTNLAMVNLETSSITVTVTSGGSIQAQTVPAGSYVQINNVGSWPDLPSGFTTVAVSGNGCWAGAVSTIDPSLGDPTT